MIRTNSYTVMRDFGAFIKYLIFWLAYTFTASCSSESEITLNGDTTPAKQRNVILTAVIINGSPSPSSRSTFNSEGVYIWGKNEKIAVLSADSLVEFSMTSGAGTDTAAFSGVVDGKVTSSYALYPYSPNYTYTTGDKGITAINYVLPDVYDDFVSGRSNLPMYSKIPDISKDTAYFYMLTGVLRYELKNLPTGTKKVSFVIDGNITGKCVLNASAPEKPYLEAPDGGQVVTYILKDTLTSESDVQFDVPVPSGTYNSFDVNAFSSADELLATIRFQQPLSMAPGLIQVFPVDYAAATTTVSYQCMSQKIPLLVFNTKNEEMPTCDYVTHPEGCFGEGITNATKVETSLAVWDYRNGISYESGNYSKENGTGLTIKIRGNTSAYSAQKPYKLKFTKKIDLLFRGDNKYEDKEWLLLNPNIKTYFGNWVNEIVGLEYTPRQRLVNVVINDKYMGMYILSESVERNPECRINVDKKGGYIIERDPYWWNEEVCFSTPLHNSPYKYTFKYPDPDDITDLQIEYIQKYMEDVEAAINNGTYNDYVDVTSFAAWLLGQDILGISDIGGSNMYFSKYDNSAGTLLKMPNLWDFDFAMGISSDKWTGHHTDPNCYYPALLSSENLLFKNTYKSLWETIEPDLYDYISTKFNSLKTSDESTGWGQQNLQYQETTILKWLSSRIEWLSQNVPVIP